MKRGMPEKMANMMTRTITTEKVESGQAYPPDAIAMNYKYNMKKKNDARNNEIIIAEKNVEIPEVPFSDTSTGEMNVPR